MFNYRANILFLDYANIILVCIGNVNTYNCTFNLITKKTKYILFEAIFIFHSWPSISNVANITKKIVHV